MADITCPLCQELPSNPVEAPCCGAIYCWDCVLDTRQCAGCGLHLLPDMCGPVNRVIENLLKNQKKQPSNGLPDFANPNTPIPCPERCGEAIAISKMEKHLASCPEVFLACPNGCAAQIQRKLIEGHVDDFCPLTPVACPYGCPQKMPRASLHEHVDGNVDLHLQQLVKKVKEQEEEIKHLKKHDIGLAAVCHAAQKVAAHIPTPDALRQSIKSHFPPAVLLTVTMFVLGLLMLSKLPLFIQGVTVFVCWKKYPWKAADDIRMLFKVKAFVALTLMWVISQASFWLLVFVVAPVVWLMYLSRQELLDALQRIVNA